MCLIVSTFVEIVSYPINTVHRLSLRLDEEQLRSFTQRPALTDLVNIEHEGNRQQDARSCLVHPLDHVDSEVWFSCNQVIFWCVLCVFGKKHAVFKWKDTIFRFPVSPGSAEALFRWGAKVKYILIAYFLVNTCAKNCRNRTVYINIASQRWDVFWDTV